MEFTASAPGGMAIGCCYTYAKLGIRHATCFIGGLDADSVRTFGEL